MIKNYAIVLLIMLFSSCKDYTEIVHMENFTEISTDSTENKIIMKRTDYFVVDYNKTNFGSMRDSVMVTAQKFANLYKDNFHQYEIFFYAHSKDFNKTMLKEDPYDVGFETLLDQKRIAFFAWINGDLSVSEFN